MIFGLTCVYWKLHNFVIVPLGIRSLVSKYGGKNKEKIHEIVWQDLCMLWIYYEKRAMVTEFKSIFSKVLVWILWTAGETLFGIGFVFIWVGGSCVVFVRIRG